jgi:hypothetical protein
MQRVLPTVYRIKKLKKRPRSEGLYSHREKRNTYNFCTRITYYSHYVITGYHSNDLSDANMFHDVSYEMNEPTVICFSVSWLIFQY